MDEIADAPVDERTVGDFKMGRRRASTDRSVCSALEHSFLETLTVPLTTSSVDDVVRNGTEADQRA